MAPPPPQARKGSGLGGLLVALLLFGVLLAGAGGVAGWYFFLRKPDVKPEDLPSSQVTPTPLPTAPPGTQTAEATPTPGMVLTPPPSTPTPAATYQPPPGTQTADTRPYPPPTSRPMPPPPTPSESSADYGYLDDEGSVPSDAQAGQRLADAYRSRQGHGSQGSYGASGRFARRKPSQPTQNPVERAAIATLRHILIVQAAYQRQHGRYGTFEDLKGAGLLRLDVMAQARQFARKGYAFALRLEDEGFRVDATPTNPGLRAFKGDESNFIIVADE